MKRWLLGLFCLLLSGATLAAGSSVVRERAVGSMLVTGWIEVAPSGKVARYDVDQPSKLPQAVVKLIGQSISTWMFEPVEIAGKPVIAKARMSLRVVADPVRSGYYQVKIAGAEFAAPEGKAKIATDEISEKRHFAPIYPRDAADSDVSGTVYVLVMVNRRGDVEHALAQQVDLKVVANDSQMKAFRRLLAEAATRAVKQWTFNAPTTGPEAGKPFWFGRIPITFILNNRRPPAYGQWDVYIPGPEETAPWIHQLLSIANDKLIVTNVDSTPPGGNFSLTSGLHLITKLSGS
jgi:hypothetical protein